MCDSVSARLSDPERLGKSECSDDRAAGLYAVDGLSVNAQVNAVTESTSLDQPFGVSVTLAVRRCVGLGNLDSVAGTFSTYVLGEYVGSASPAVYLDGESSGASHWG